MKLKTIHSLIYFSFIKISHCLNEEPNYTLIKTKEEKAINLKRVKNVLKTLKSMPSELLNSLINKKKINIIIYKKI